MLLNNQWVKEKIKREIKYLEKNEMEIQHIKIYGTKQKQFYVESIYTCIKENLSSAISFLSGKTEV